MSNSKYDIKSNENTKNSNNDQDIKCKSLTYDNDSYTGTKWKGCSFSVNRLKQILQGGNNNDN